MITPRYLALLTLFNEQSSIFIQCLLSYLILDRWKIMKKVFCVFTVNLLDRNHADRDFNSALITIISLVRSLPLRRTHVSSAYSIVNKSSETLQMSFMLRINSNGPKIEP